MALEDQHLAVRKLFARGLCARHRSAPRVHAKRSRLWKKPPVYAHARLQDHTNPARGRGRITKAGNSRARMLLVEAAWLILRSKHPATAALRGWAKGHHRPLNRPVLLVTNSGPSCIAQWFREELAKVKIAATGVSAFSQVRIEDPMPTQLGLPEHFDETLKAEEVYWDLYADPRVGWSEKDQKTEAQPKTESA